MQVGRAKEMTLTVPLEACKRCAIHNSDPFGLLLWVSGKKASGCCIFNDCHVMTVKSACQVRLATYPLVHAFTRGFNDLALTCW
jgi:hypothetical protein